MKIKMQFGGLKTGIIAAIAGVSLVLIVIDALLLGGVFGEAVNVVVASISLVAGAIIFVSSLTLLFGSKYVIGEETIKCVFGFFYTVEIAYTSVISVRQNVVSGQVFVSVENQKGGMSSLTLNLSKDNGEVVAKEIATKSKMLVDYYTPDKKEN